MKIIGHRGARGLAPENTLASLEKAIEHHVDMIEFDLRVTSDNQVILHHDADLIDASGNRLSIAGHTLAELLPHKPDLTLFEDAIKLINNEAGLMIEIKPNVDVKQIVSIILESKLKLDEMIICSFSYDSLVRIKKLLPTAIIMIIEPWSGVRASHRARKLNTKLISMNQRWLWWGFIKSMSSDYQLYTYTINDAEKAHKWAKYGLAGVITDYPDTM
jgi:glycerophosphoryl diester phosphodiesterase